MTVKAMVDRRDQMDSEDPAKLIAYAAHDLMTPLTGVQLSLSLLAEDEEVQEKLNPHQMELLTSATNCSDLMIRICEAAIESLRNIRPAVAAGTTDAATTVPLATEDDDNVTDIVDLVKSLKLIMEPIPKLVPLIITLDPAVPHTIRSDDLKLFRSVLNLVSTAIQRTSTGKVHVKIFVRDQELVFECEDTAEDIPVEDYQYLFQGNGGSKHENPLLLTLASVASLVKSMDGAFGYRPRNTSPDGTALTDQNRKPLKGSVFWFSVRLEAVREAHGDRKNDGLKKSASGLLRKQRSTSKTYFPMMLRCGSNSSISLHTSSLSHGKRMGSFSNGIAATAPRPRESLANAVFDDPITTDQKPPAIPRDIMASATVARADTTADYGPRRKQALVIEDSLVVRKGLARALSNLGFDVQQAVNGLEGLKAMKETMFDMVLCDFLMPVMDGLDCVKQYRDWEERNRPSHRQPIIGISAHVSVADSDQGIKAGMDDFRPKPISIKTLTELQGNEAVVASARRLNDMERTSPSPATNGVDLSKQQQASKRKQPPTVEGDNVKRPKTSSIKIEDSTPEHPVCLLAMDSSTLESNDFQKVLESTGWSVVAVHEGKDAVRLLQMRNWDAVLIADDIPGLAATKCIAAFREWEEKNRVNEQRRVFLVCDSDIPGPFDSSSLVQPPSGFNGVLSKPIVWKELDFLVKKRSNNMKIVFRR
jgi:CheY-like chemotaxis protein